MFDAEMADTYRLAEPQAAAHALSPGKRALDLGLAAILLLAALPFLLAVGVAIRLESGGPALFRQRRGGLGGKPFTIYKLRTMTVTEDGPHVVQARRGDSRCTRLGAWLRRTSLDELPQLVNVLRGEMSLVGPRPHTLIHDDEFSRLVPMYRRRQDVRPGITGLAQVRGRRGETRSARDVLQRVACDVEYIDNWSLSNDLKILASTLKVPLDPRAY